MPKAVCEDALPLLLDTRIPPPLQYPIADIGFGFVSSLVKMFYGHSVADKVGALTLNYKPQAPKLYTLSPKP